MDLSLIWFLIIVYLFAGYFFLEGFDFGVGMLLPFTSHEDIDRRMMVSSIAGVWDGNEVWLVTGGAAMFSSFPHWYATLFSSFYPIFMLILLALILRGISIKFRNHSSPGWRRWWDWAMFSGSLVTSFCWGLIVANMVRGIPINEKMTYVGGFLNFFNSYALLLGVLFVALFMWHGALFLGIKTTGTVLKRIETMQGKLFLLTVVLAVAGLVYSQIEIQLLRSGLVIGLISAAVILLLLSGILAKRKPVVAFFSNGFAIVFLSGAFFAYLFPRVLVSSLDPAWSLTVENASASAYSLKVQGMVALFFIPLVGFYEAWSYWVLRKRIEKSDLAY